MKTKSHGTLVLFGSGETLSTGRRIHRKVLESFPAAQHVAILETPAGFQPNSPTVALEIANVFNNFLNESVSSVSIIPARKKSIQFSPDNEAILKPLETADYIFLGPGSPTYAAKQLRRSKALNIIVERWRNGATLSLSSAAAIAVGTYCLPVYEIYKVGTDLYWEKGLSLLNQVGLPLTIITHWNNKEGGIKLDTRYCYMGEERFKQLYGLLPREAPILGIDEHTGVIFNFQKRVFSVEGKGNATLIQPNTQITFTRGSSYTIDSLTKGHAIVSPTHAIGKKVVHKKGDLHKKIPIQMLDASLTHLLKERGLFRGKGNFKESDRIRDILRQHGYNIEDIDGRQEIYKIKRV